MGKERNTRSLLRLGDVVMLLHVFNASERVHGLVVDNPENGFVVVRHYDNNVGSFINREYPVAEVTRLDKQTKSINVKESKSKEKGYKFDDKQHEKQVKIWIKF